MVSKRLRCVMMLTAVTLLALCQIDNVTARASGAAKPQTQDFGSLRFPNQLRSRRRWPARLLLSGRTSSIVSAFTHSRVGKLLFTKRSQQQIVTDLFKSHKVKEANAQNFFKSHQFMNWKSKVKAKYGKRSEELMFSTMYEKYNARDNGGLTAIIAQAIKDSDTHDLGLRFEDLLLEKLAPGVKKTLVGSKEDADFTDIREYLRYSYYRDSEDMFVHQNMIQKVSDPLFPNKIHSIKNYLKEDSPTPFVHLDRIFKIISGKREVADVFKELRREEGFNNNAYLLHKLYEQAGPGASNVVLADFMLTKLREAGWTDDQFVSHLLDLTGKTFSPNLREILLDPMVREYKVQGFSLNPRKT